MRPYRRRNGNRSITWSSCIARTRDPPKRKQRAVDRLMSAAEFRELTSLEGFDWEFNPKGIDRRTIEQLATCDFVRRRENVVFVGQSGLGKSRILQAIGRAACVLGYNSVMQPAPSCFRSSLWRWPTGPMPGCWPRTRAGLFADRRFRF